MASYPKGPTCFRLPGTAVTSVCTTMSHSSSRVMGTNLRFLCFQGKCLIIWTISCFIPVSIVNESMWLRLCEFKESRLPASLNCWRNLSCVVELSCSLWITYLIFTSIFHQLHFHQFNRYTPAYWWSTNCGVLCQTVELQRKLCRFEPLVLQCLVPHDDSLLNT